MESFKYIIFSIFFLLLTGCKKDTTIYQDVSFNTYLLKKVDTLDLKLDRLIESVSDNKDSLVVRQAFIESRLAYKEVEWAIAYFLPHTNKSLNGPALDQLDLDENKFIPAEGFQVVEELVFPVYQSAEQQKLILESKKIKNFAYGARKNFEVISIDEKLVLEALKMELFQITALGITGFDTPESQLQFIEAGASLKGVKEVLELSGKWREAKAYRKLKELLDKSIVVCNANPSKESFNYLDFITDNLEPIAQGIVFLQQELNIPFHEGNQVVSGRVASLFAKDLINLNAFLPDPTYYLSPAKIALGKELFFDKNLSKNSHRSCADCHHADKAFSDGLKTAMDLEGKPLKRNTPSLNYAAYYHGQFWDMRSVTLESQSSDVITNKDEMHGDLKEIATFLNQSPTYKKAFQKVYSNDKPIESWQLENALASYIRSLAVFESRFDQYMRGDKTAMDEQEKRGFNLFVGKAKCASCHFMPVFNGTLPPFFTNSEQEVLGVPKDKAGTMLDDDLGRYVFNTDLKQLKHAFKTPTIRNIEKSAPYMHNGVYETLEEVMDFYNKGGGIGLGLDVESQTLPDAPLELTDQEIKDIIVFMKTLNDTSP